MFFSHSSALLSPPPPLLLPGMCVLCSIFTQVPLPQRRQTGQQALCSQSLQWANRPLSFPASPPSSPTPSGLLQALEQQLSSPLWCCQSLVRCVTSTPLLPVVEVSGFRDDWLLEQLQNYPVLALLGHFPSDVHFGVTAPDPTNAYGILSCLC